MHTRAQPVRCHIAHARSLERIAPAPSSTNRRASICCFVRALFSVARARSAIHSSRNSSTLRQRSERGAKARRHSGSPARKAAP